MGFIMKNSSIVFLGMMLLFLAVPSAMAAEKNNVSKLTVQGEGKVTHSSGYGDNRAGRGDPEMPALQEPFRRMPD